jgi:hypothetical protein
MKQPASVKNRPMKKLFLLVGIIVVMLVSCKQKSNETVITKKIQYDVNIKSPDANWDWWIQNLVGPDREKLVNMLMDGALSGEFQAYDYFSDSIKPADIKLMLADTFYLTYKRSTPPYDEYDTTVIMKISRNDILRIRFLEEWRINPETMQFDKKVLGIGPVARRIDLSGTERWQPLFWIYTDKDFIRALSKRK